MASTRKRTSPTRTKRKPATPSSSRRAKPSTAAAPAAPRTKAPPAAPSTSSRAKSSRAKSSSAKSSSAKSSRPKPAASAKKPRVFTLAFASVYPLYVQKAAKKGRTQAEVDAVIAWLTGYEGSALAHVLDARLDIETFFATAPRLHPRARAVTGVVCGVRVEDVADPLMRKIRILDKLIDELARGKPLERVLREA